MSRSESPCDSSAIVVVFALLLPAPAQIGQIVPGTNVGWAMAAGDVDDDGRDDYFVRLPQAYEVRSGATGIAFSYLGRTAIAGSFYFPLLGDLNADGHDDLVWSDGSSLSEFVSGLDGSVLFQHSMPLSLVDSERAFDHNGDGHDDVIVRQRLPSSSTSGTLNFRVLSGGNGSTIAVFSVPYTHSSTGRVQWCGDVNGDGHVDLLRTTTFLGNPSTQVLTSPSHTVQASYSGIRVAPAGDTNADARDEIAVGTNLLDVLTGTVVWSMPSLVSTSFCDVDGDGAADALTHSASFPPQTFQVYSGRTQAAWAATLPSFIDRLGDIDGDGRDELVANNTLYELQGTPPASSVRDRGAAGTTSAPSRPRIRHRLRPRLGGSMRIDLVGAGGPRFAFLAIGGAIDTDLAPFGAAGNRAYVSPFVALGQFADNSGYARYALAVPSTAVLIGAALSLQWVVLDPAANALGIATSNAIDFVVGN